MAKPLALVTGDWHIRKVDRAWYRRDTLCGDTQYGINQVCQLAEQHDVANVLLLGDLFDQKLQMSTALQYMRRALDTFQKQARPVYYVQGQHELSRPPILEALHPWPVHAHGHGFPLTKNGPRIHGLDYQKPSDVQAALEATPADDILITHQVWRDFIGERNADAWLHWSPATYVLSGDFHQTVWEQRGTQWVMSPGPLCMQSISEPHDKYVFVLNEDMTATRLRINTRGYFENRIHTEQELEQFLDTWNRHPARMPQGGVPSALSTNIIRVWYREDVTDARMRITARVGIDAHLFLKTIPVEAAAISVDNERRVQAVIRGGLEGCIREFYAESAEACADAVRLVQSQDVDDELLHIFKERAYGSDNGGKGTLP